MKKFNKKALLMLFFVLVLSLSHVFTVTCADADSENSTKLYLDGKLIVIPETLGKPFDSDGITYVPLRAIADALGISVKWIQEEQAIIYGDEIKFRIGSDMMEVPYGMALPLYAKVLAKDGRVYLPITFFTEITGHEIAWDEESAGINKIKLEDVVRLEGSMYIVDTSRFVAPIYNDGYQMIDVYDGLVGFNEISNVGVWTSNTALQEDIEHFNNTILKNTLTNFSENGDYYLTAIGTPFKVFRDENNNPVLGIYHWGLNRSSYKNLKTMTTMNLTAELLRYYTGKDSDAKAIWAFTDYCAKTKTNPVFNRIYLFGETKIKYIDPGRYGVEIVILKQE
ncbi:MAG: hypothetical protein GX201_10720 [Clostridiales bacterium]|nr:hypothetical protein [Clostridiales bacterium]